MKLKASHILLLFLYGIVCFLDVMSAQSLTTANKSQDPQLKKYILTFAPSSPSSSACKKLRKDLQTLQAGDITMYEEAGIAMVTSSDSDFESKAASLEGLSSVKPDRVIKQSKRPTKAADASVLIKENDYKKSRSSDDRSDPLVELQWGLEAIHAREVHKAGYKGKGVRVAVISGGFDLDHPDIRHNIDYRASASFVPGESLQFIPPADGSDPFSYGTIVASVIAAGENGVGIVGVAPKATLILMKALSDVTFTGETSWAISAVLEAVKARADVISISLSDIYNATDPQLAEDLALFTQVFTYAHKKGIVLVTTSAFDSLNLDEASSVVLPLAAPYVIGVSSTAPIGWLEDPLRRSLDNIASYSNIGKSVIDLAAPGGDVISPNTTEVTYEGITSPVWLFDNVIGANYDNTWSFGNDLGFAHVSGVAALIVGKYHGKITPCKVERILRESADDLGKLGSDASYGYGRLNAYNALIRYDSYEK